MNFFTLERLDWAAQLDLLVSLLQLVAGLIPLLVPKRRLRLTRRPWVLVWLLVPAGLLGLGRAAVKVWDLGASILLTVVVMQGIHVLTLVGFLIWAGVRMWRNTQHERAITAQVNARITDSEEPVSLPVIEGELRMLIASGYKIPAIKRVREVTGMGLKEAKAYVDALERERRATRDD